MTWLLSISTILASGMLCGPAPAGACTCLRSPDPRSVGEMRTALPSRDALFTGHVLSTTFRPDSVQAVTVTGDSTWVAHDVLAATVEVWTVWQGEVPDTVQVETPVHPTMCGAQLDADADYLIDAQWDAQGVLQTTTCSWTRGLREATELLRLLRRARG